MATKNLYLVVGPSGSGKTVLTDSLERLGFKRARTTTTRERRKGEPADAYFFTSAQEFRSAAWDGKFAEYTRYCGNWYGSTFEALNAADFAVLEPEGAETVLQRYHQRPVRVVYLFADTEQLRERIQGRSDGSVQRVLLDVKKFCHMPKYADLCVRTVTPQQTLEDVLDYISSQNDWTPEKDR